jgi:hypothetical protein
MNYTFHEKDHNIIFVCNKLLKKLNIKVSLVTIRKDFDVHPEFPGLLAISDCLVKWGIENSAFKISKENLKFEDLSYPLIAHLTEKGGHFILLESGDQNYMTFSDENHNRQRITKVDFLKRWSGVLLYANSNGNGGEKKYYQNQLLYLLGLLRFPTAMLLTATILTYLVLKSPVSLYHILMFSAKFAGMVVSMILLNSTINSNNPLMRNLCGQGDNSDCNTILRSEASKITSWLSWSEVGFIYFSATLIYLVLNPINSVLFWYNILALPYTVYSIFYQYAKKNWCILCCSVQVLLWIEFLLNATLIHEGWNQFALIDLIKSTVIFFIPIMIWTYLKPLLVAAAQLKPANQQLKKFKYNRDLFMQMLTDQPRYAIDMNLSPVVLGNEDAQNIITVVSNPFCRPCADVHRYIDEWLNTDSRIKVNILFATTSQNDSPKNKFLNKLNNRELVSRALNEWYESNNKNYMEWALNFPLEADQNSQTITDKQNAWCEMADIISTPTILLNGYKIPVTYQLEDLKYFLN